MRNFLFKIQEHSGDGGKNDQCVNVPSGVFTINSMSSSFPVCAFIYTKNSLSSTLPLNSQQYTSVCHFVGISANPSLIISKSLFNTSFAFSFEIIFVSNVLSVCEFKYPEVSIPSTLPSSSATFTFIKSGYIVTVSLLLFVCVYA